MEKCLFKYIFSKWTSLAIVEFNLWLMHSLEVDSPDLPRKLRKSKFPGCTAARDCGFLMLKKKEKKKKKQTKIYG